MGGRRRRASLPRGAPAATGVAATGAGSGVGEACAVEATSNLFSNESESTGVGPSAAMRGSRSSGAHRTSRTRSTAAKSCRGTPPLLVRERRPDRRVSPLVCPRTRPLQPNCIPPTASRSPVPRACSRCTAATTVVSPILYRASRRVHPSSAAGRVPVHIAPSTLANTCAAGACHSQVQTASCWSCNCRHEDFFVFFFSNCCCHSHHCAADHCGGDERSGA